MSTKVILKENLQEAVEELTRAIKPKTIIGFIGDLGFGKTTLISHLLQNFGCEITHSPTFALVNKYELNTKLIVYHIDLYRLQNSEEIESSGFWDLFSDESAVFIIEWVDRLELGNLPLDFQKIIVEIKKKSDHSRDYHINWL